MLDPDSVVMVRGGVVRACVQGVCVCVCLPAGACSCSVRLQPPLSVGTPRILFHPSLTILLLLLVLLAVVLLRCVVCVAVPALAQAAVVADSGDLVQAAIDATGGAEAKALQRLLVFVNCTPNPVNLAAALGSQGTLNKLVAYVLDRRYGSSERLGMDTPVVTGRRFSIDVRNPLVGASVSDMLDQLLECVWGGVWSVAWVGGWVGVQRGGA